METKENRYGQKRVSLKSTARKSGSKRVQTVLCVKNNKVDKSQAKMCDINNIVKYYTKTGMFPAFKQKQPKFLDMTAIPTLMEATEIVAEAQEMFYDLPAKIRALMGHDPANLEEFLKDPKNHDVLVEYGVLEKKEVDDTLPKQEEKVDEVPENKEELSQE